MRISSLFSRLLVLPMAVLLLAGCSQTNDAAESAGGEPLFASFTAVDLDGNTVDQTLWADHTLTMVNVWGTFCAPCLREMPDLALLADEYEEKGVQLVGIPLDTLSSQGGYDEDQVAKAKELAEETGADYLHILPSMDLIELKLGDVTAVPETFFVDSAGAMVGEPVLGSRSAEKWRKILDERLEQVKEAARS